jgi:hypothetical protein
MTITSTPRHDTEADPKTLRDTIAAHLAPLAHR